METNDKTRKLVVLDTINSRAIILSMYGINLGTTEDIEAYIEHKTGLNPQKVDWAMVDEIENR